MTENPPDLPAVDGRNLFGHKPHPLDEARARVADAVRHGLEGSSGVLIDDLAAPAGSTTFPGRFLAPAFRIRLAGRPYLAYPYSDGPGFGLYPDRAQRFADRAGT